MDTTKNKNGISVAISTAGDMAKKSKEAVVNVIDQNENGQIDIEDVIILGMKTPGVKIDRESFLRKELFKNHPTETIEDAIKYTPLHAKISEQEIEKLANETIKFERNCVSGISTALGTPGGFAMVATIPVDIAQYYGYMLRTAQKLLYLYGFPDMGLSNGQILDTEIINTLTVCLGVMYGVQGANIALKAMAVSLGQGVKKQLMSKALTKGTLYPIVRSVSKWFGVRMTKEVFSNFFKKSIPVIGGVIGGTITFVTFKPCCEKLKSTLKNTMLSNPDYQISDEVQKIVTEIEATDTVVD